MRDTHADAGSEAPPQTPRRSFIVRGALAALGLTARRAGAQRRARRRGPVARPSQPPPESVDPAEHLAAFAEWDTGGLSRLVRRVTMGITPDELTLANRLGWDEYLEYHLNYTRIDDSALEAAVAARYPYTIQTSDQLYAITQASGGLTRITSQLRDSTVFRAAFSKRQLHERMVEFWSDHLNQAIDKVQYLQVADQRDVIRKYAMTTVPALIRASAHSASMMIYLDQNTSRSGAPNQNYAREVMELHTLGVDGGYTQQDVAELSRVLTGWTVAGRGTFTFNPQIHDWGAKTVLGLTIPAASPSTGGAGIAEGEAVLDMLTHHPSAARFIATKLLRWMVTPTPSDVQISTIAAVYRATGGDIKAMLRAMLNDAWLPPAPMKLKRPFHLAVSALRGLSPTVQSVTPLTSALGAMGHTSFAWETPDGYPDKIAYWAGNIVPRWAFGSQLAALNSSESIAFDTTPYRGGSPAAAVDLIEQNVFGGEMPLATRTALLSYVGAGTFNDTRVRETVALAIGSNAFQWY